MTAMVIRARPSAVSCNIRTWIGFKQFFDLLEAGVLAWIEAQGISPRELYHAYGLAVEMADVSAQLPAVLELGDDVEISITSRPRGGLTATISVARGDMTVVALKASITVALCEASLSMATMGAMVKGDGRPVSTPRGGSARGVSPRPARSRLSSNRSSERGLSSPNGAPAAFWTSITVPLGASALLRWNLLGYGVGGIIAPFIGIKIIDLIITHIGWA